MNFQIFREAKRVPSQAKRGMGECGERLVVYTFIFLILILLVVLPSFAFLAEEDLEETCKIETLEELKDDLPQTEYRQILEKCQDYYQELSLEIEKDITKTEKEKNTLTNQISLLKKKIKNLDYQIYQSNLMVKDLQLQIGDTSVSIDKTSLKIEDSKERISVILRTIYEEDQKSLYEILVSENTLSDFFENLVALEKLNVKNRELLEEIKILKFDLEEQKEDLETDKTDLEKAVILHNLQKEESEQTKKETDYFLKITESEYQKQLREQQEIQKKAQEIRARIFELVGVPEAPTFGEAYELAKYVEGITGIRPALLLAVLTQESNIGKNVGQCYLQDPKTGAGIYIKTGSKRSKVMSPRRDVPHFLKICAELGRDPYQTPVSCPMSYGWGGAMGPAQFIPATWQKYKERVRAITGSADPWNIKDAFVAAALYLTDYGAAKRTYNSEWSAAMIYFSGTTNKKYRFYGDSVMSLASRYQKDIDALESS